MVGKNTGYGTTTVYPICSLWGAFLEKKMHHLVLLTAAGTALSLSPHKAHIYILHPSICLQSQTQAAHYVKVQRITVYT